MKFCFYMNRTNSIYIIFFLLLLCVPKTAAQSRDAVETSTDVLMFLPGAVGAGVSLLNGDYEGFWQLAKSGTLSVAAAYALKYTIHKKRPDASDNHSFPSNHAGVAFAGAAYLQRRYGWAWGAPAYAVASYVSWGRVYSKKHDAWDVMAGAAIGACCAYICTRPYSAKHNMSAAPLLLPDGGYGLTFSMNL